MTSSGPGGGFTYKDAGVDIDAGERLVERIRPLASIASRPEVLSGIGGFAGLFALPARYRDPVLVSGTDGVGTKIKTAFATGRHDTVGIDLVAMSVNDVAVTGAEPLFFLDYFATSRLDVAVGEAVVRGIAEGCRQAGCALLGGETAEMPGMYAEGEYDLAGFCVGVVERSELKGGSALAAGDVLVGLHSSGLHSNGHSLARKVLLEGLALQLEDTPPELGGARVADALLRPTRIYVAALRALSAAGVNWKAAAHITGGGLIENPPRMLAGTGAALAIELAPHGWPMPPIFPLLASAGIHEAEMRRTFNLGIGMLVAISAAEKERALACLAAAGQPASIAGVITARPPGAPSVVFV
jgi:phosphoribosylformylglycinamidine cyclo-ligase